MTVRSIKKSRMGPRRAIVLALVNLAMIAHLLMWIFSGMRKTLSPVEPSESMYTLETGALNAGFVFFVLAILATLVFGRFFCGWGCHVVALQDLCAWAMKKLGVHPRPFRTRLLIIAPLILAIYMFVVPTVRREVIRPLVVKQWGTETKEQAEARWRKIEPIIGPAPADRPALESHFFVEDFWKTFPPWYVAIPFLLVCGFATVYFLGAKGFCTYGCPYGGFFAPIDKVAPGKIVVNSNCEHCGHCTAVCTSNVRVHEEVRDFGMVVDPGCMKCMDCVSVCPNEALSFQFSKPSILAKPMTEAAKQRRVVNPRNYDLTIRGELAVGAVFAILYFGFRGWWMDSVPLLMAIALGAIGAFFSWKLASMVREKNVRLANLQLRIKGRVTRAGWAFGLLAPLYIAAGLWGAFVNVFQWHADVLDTWVETPVQTVFSPDYKPPAREKDLAQRAIASYLRASSPSDGGYGWPMDIRRTARVAWLSAVAGDLAKAEVYQKRVVEMRARKAILDGSELRDLSILMSLQGASAQDVLFIYERVAADYPRSAAARLALASMQFQLGNTDAGVESAERAIALAGDTRKSTNLILGACNFLMGAGKIDRAAEVLEAILKVEPDSSGVHGLLAVAHAARNLIPEAITHMRRAAELEPRNPLYWSRLSQLLASIGDSAGAEQAAKRAEEASKRKNR